MRLRLVGEWVVELECGGYAGGEGGLWSNFLHELCASMNLYSALLYCSYRWFLFDAYYANELRLCVYYLSTWILMRYYSIAIIGSLFCAHYVNEWCICIHGNDIGLAWDAIKQLIANWLFSHDFCHARTICKLCILIEYRHNFVCLIFIFSKKCWFNFGSNLI